MDSRLKLRQAAFKSFAVTCATAQQKRREDLLLSKEKRRTLNLETLRSSFASAADKNGSWNLDTHDEIEEEEDDEHSRINRQQNDMVENDHILKPEGVAKRPGKKARRIKVVDFSQKLCGSIVVSDLAEGLCDSETDPESTSHQHEVQRFKKITQWKPVTVPQFISSQLQLPDPLLCVPEDLSNWSFVVRPEGDHVMVFVSSGRAVVRSKSGSVIRQFRFDDFEGDSIFDGLLTTSPLRNDRMENQRMADSPFDNSFDTIYVLDSLLLNGVELADTSFETRRFFLSSKFSESTSRRCQQNGIPLVYLESSAISRDLLLSLSDAYSSFLQTGRLDSKTADLSTIPFPSALKYRPSISVARFYRPDDFSSFGLPQTTTMDCDINSVFVPVSSRHPESPVFVPDGILFIHTQSPYLPGWSPLVLHLRTPALSKWAPKPPDSLMSSVSPTPSCTAVMVWDGPSGEFRTADGLTLRSENVENTIGTNNGINGSKQKFSPLAFPLLVKIEFVPTGFDADGRFTASHVKVVKMFQHSRKPPMRQWRTYADCSGKILEQAGFVDGEKLWLDILEAS